MLTKKKQNDISATVANNYLVLSLPNAVEPVIWRKSLDEIGSTTFEVKKATKKDLYNLTLKKTKTTSETIASFDEKNDAIDALNAASDAFHNRGLSKSINTNTANQNEKQSSGGGTKWIYAIIALFIVIGLYIYMNSLIPEQNTFENNSASTAAPNTSPASPAAETGVPVSADDFLNSLQ